MLVFIVHNGQNHGSGSEAAVTVLPAIALRQRSCHTAVQLLLSQTTKVFLLQPRLQLKHRSCLPSGPSSIDLLRFWRSSLGFTVAAAIFHASRSLAYSTHVCVLTPARRIVSLMHCAVDMYGRPARRFARTQLVKKRRGRRFSGIRATWPAHLIRRSSIVA